MKSVRWMGAALALGMGLAAAAPASAQVTTAADTTWQEMWAPGAMWVTAGAGYAKNIGVTAGSGLLGGSLGFNWMARRNWSLHAFAGQDLYGKFGPSADIGVPIGVTVQRHFPWKTALRPYLGIGYGVTMHRYFRTGDDKNQTAPVFYVTTGADAPVSPGRMIGISARIGFTKLDEPNAVFNPLETNPDGTTSPSWDNTQLWSVQLRYGVAL